MAQSDPIELALNELETKRALQDTELHVSFAALARFGNAMLDIDAEQLRRLSDCAECTAYEQNADPALLIGSLRRC